MMDYDKLIEQLNAWNEQHLSVVCGSKHFACDYLCENEDCIVVRAATAISTLQAENEKLRADVIRFNDLLASYQNVFVPELRAELEKVKQERDAATADLEEIMFKGGHNIDTCYFCTNSQCYGRGGMQTCNPKWRGPHKED